MDYTDLIAKEDDYISFKGFEKVKNLEVTLRIVLYGSKDETELLIESRNALDV